VLLDRIKTHVIIMINYISGGLVPLVFSIRKKLITNLQIHNYRKWVSLCIIIESKFIFSFSSVSSSRMQLRWATNRFGASDQSLEGKGGREDMSQKEFPREVYTTQTQNEVNRWWEIRRVKNWIEKDFCIKMRNERRKNKLEITLFGFRKKQLI